MDKKVLVREYKGEYYVQRPTSWMAGWARHLMLRRVLCAKVSIASPEFWNTMETESRTVIVEQDKEGNWNLV